MFATSIGEPFHISLVYLSPSRNNIQNQEEKVDRDSAVPILRDILLRFMV